MLSLATIFFYELGVVNHLFAEDSSRGIEVAANGLCLSQTVWLMSWLSLMPSLLSAVADQQCWRETGVAPDAMDRHQD